MSHIFGTNVDLNENEILNLRAENLIAFPTSPLEGRIIMHSGLGQFYGFDGDSWIHLGDVGGGNYTLPTATTSTLGGIKVDGTTLSIDSATGIVTVIGGTGGSSYSVTDYRSSFESSDGYIYSGYLLDTVETITRDIDGVYESATGLTDLETDWTNRLTLTYV